MFSLKLQYFGFWALLLCAGYSSAATLSDIRFSELPGERAEVRLAFDTPPNAPTGYAIEQPARIVLDFSDVQNALPERKYAMRVGDVSSAIVVEGGGRTRLIVNLENSVPYRSFFDGNEFVVEVGVADSQGNATFVAPENVAVAPAQTVATSSAASTSPSAPVGSSSRPSIRNIDFRRGEDGEGKIIVSISDPSIRVDVEEVSSGVQVKFHDAFLPAELQRKLDVVDFATPVSMISSSLSSDGSTVIGVKASGEYDYLAYQADNEYVINIKPLTELEIAQKKKEFNYTGDRLSLNFQSIPVRNVLQLLADFTGLNLVASDTVTGSITLRLDNVPWDQALDIVLKTKGLDERRLGNVMMVAPAAEIAERERQEIETQKQLEELAPLRTEYIRVRYANARELFSLFIGGAGGGGGGADAPATPGAGSGGNNARNSTGSILSERGQAIVDERTNSIILTDTEEKIEEFKRLVEKIDIPVRQVMIEARIVIANTDFRKELGIRMSGDAAEISSGGSKLHEFTGRLEGLQNDSGVGGPAQLFIDSDNNGVADGARNLTTSRLVNLGLTNPAGAFSWNVISSNFLLGMELTALQEAGFAEIVSQPKVITGDKQKASIQSGTEIPFQQESASGGTTTSFKEAVLSLDVTPQITPDDRVIIDLSITQDSISAIDQASGVPILDITQLETQVLVSDGETIVLGGIYQTDSTTSQAKVPLLGDIPFLGRLFKRDINREDKRELLLFITPRIMASNLIE